MIVENLSECATLLVDIYQFTQAKNSTSKFIFARKNSYTDTHVLGGDFPQLPAVTIHASFVNYTHTDS